MRSRSTRTPGRTPPALDGSTRATDHPLGSGGRHVAESHLARDGPDQLAQARAHRDALLSSARILVRTLAHDPDLADCAAAGCGLAGCSDAERCGLAHRLASVESDRIEDTGALPDADVERALRWFEAALTDAVDAVRRCRQTEHGTGGCWFSASPHVDGCGEVLRAAHRLG